MRYGTYLIAVIFGLIYWGQTVTDPDLGWHLLGGEWIVSNRSLPTYDFINSFNTSWHDYHWLAQILIFKIYSYGGFPLLKLSFGLLMAYFAKVVVDIIYLSSGRKPSSLLILLSLFVILSSVAYVASVRPQTIGITLIAVIIRRLLQRPTKYEIPLLLLLTVMIANMHVYWVFGPLLWGAYRVLPWLLKHARHSGSYSLGGLALLSLAGLLTPYGTDTYILLLDYIKMPAILKDSIIEFQSGLKMGVEAPIFILAYLMILSRIFTLKRSLVTVGATCTALVAPLLAVQSAKFFPLFALLGGPYMIRHGSLSMRKLIPNAIQNEARYVKTVLGALTILACIAAASRFPYLESQSTAKALNQGYPMQACQKLAELAADRVSLHGHIRVLSHFNYGGWCRWAAYQRSSKTDLRVTMDGRTQYVPEIRYKEDDKIWKLKDGWKEVLDAWAPDYAIVGIDQPFRQILKTLPEWESVHKDKYFELFSIRADTNY